MNQVKWIKWGRRKNAWGFLISLSFAFPPFCWIQFTLIALHLSATSRLLKHFKLSIRLSSRKTFYWKWNDNKNKQSNVVKNICFKIYFFHFFVGHWILVSVGIACSMKKKTFLGFVQCSFMLIIKIFFFFLSFAHFPVVIFLARKVTQCHHHMLKDLLTQVAFQVSISLAILISKTLLSTTYVIRLLCLN